MDTPPPQVGVDCGDWCAALLLSSELLFLLGANCVSDFQSSQDSLPDSVGWRSLRSELGACEPQCVSRTAGCKKRAFVAG